MSQNGLPHLKSFAPKAARFLRYLAILGYYALKVKSNFLPEHLQVTTSVNYREESDL